MIHRGRVKSCPHFFERCGRVFRPLKLGVPQRVMDAQHGRGCLKNFRVAHSSFFEGCGFLTFCTLLEAQSPGKSSPELPCRAAEIYEKLNLTSTLKSIGVASPSRTVGSYFLFETAARADGISNGCPLTARIPVTFPCSSIMASMITIPESRDWRARTGYSGSGENSRRGGFTVPPTRTGTFGPVAIGRAGG